MQETQEAGLNSWLRKIPWRRTWQPTPVFLPGESPWTEEPGGVESMGWQRVGHDWSHWAQTQTETERECKPAFMINYMGCLRGKAASIQTCKPGCEGRKVIGGKLNKPGGASRQPPSSQPLGRSLNRRGKTRCHQCLLPFSTFSASGLYPPAFLGGFPRDWLSNSYPKAAEGQRPLQWNVQRKCSCRWACDLVGDPSPLAVTVPSLLLCILKCGSCLILI